MIKYKIYIFFYFLRQRHNRNTRSKSVNYNWRTIFFDVVLMPLIITLNKHSPNGGIKKGIFNFSFDQNYFTRNGILTRKNVVDNSALDILNSTALHISWTFDWLLSIYWHLLKTVTSIFKSLSAHANFNLHKF